MISKRRIKLCLMIFILVSMININITTAGADTVARNVSQVERDDIGITLTKEHVKSFVDHYFQSNMDRWKVPGVAVAVVKDNKELYKAGYGVCDVQTKRPVDPDTTTFPSASVSKLFTATAIMQLYQEGKLDLEKDIKQYAKDLSIVNPYQKPITCQNLLTHSSGLDEESELDGSTLNTTAIKSQKYYFNKHIPRVIKEPGTLCRYSNLGYNLLGYIVEKVSGLSYEAYVKRNLLEPLNMEHSSVRIGNNSMASGYEYDNGKFYKDAFAYQYTSGSSGIISTVVDMENFMIMHLNHGKFKDRSVISPATEQMMQKKQFANHEVFDGMGEGFICDRRNGVKIIKHEGALPGYTSTLLLIPEQNFGIYIVTNSLNGLIFDFEDAFMDQFLGACKPCVKEQVLPVDVDQYIGSYRSYDGVSECNISKIYASLDSSVQLKISRTSGNMLKLTYYDQSKRRVETNLIYQSEGVFLRSDGQGYIAFRQNKKGSMEYAFNNISHQTYQKIGSLENLFFPGLILLMILLFVSSIVLLIRRIKHKLQCAEKLWTLCCAVNLSYVVAFVGVFLLESYMILSYNYRYLNVIYALLTVLLIAVLGNICGVISSIYAMMKKRFDRSTIIKLSIITVAQLGFLIIAGYYHMLGYHVY